MYSVSNNYLNALAAPVKTFRLIGTVGTVSFDESNIIDISIDNQVSEGSEIKIGSVYAGVLTATFNGLTIARGSWVGKTITLSEGLLIDADNDTYEDVPLGIFTVAEANHTAEGVEVTAYDAMTNFDKTRNDLTDTGTAYAFLTLMCQKCGVTLGSTLADIQALPNGTETFSIYAENDIETWRDLLSWIAQTLGAVATIGRDGKLYLRQYSMTAAATIDETHRFTGCSFSDFVTYYTGMSVVDIALRQTEYKSEVVDDGLTYNLGSNPLVQGHYEYVQEIIDDFSNVALTPFSAQMLGGAIYDLCDCLTFSGGIAAGATCGVMGYTWKYNGAYSVKGFGANPALATAKSKTQKELEALYNTVGQDINEMSVVQNSTAVTIAENTETSILKYNFEVTQEENTTMVDVSVVMTATATEQLVGEIYTLGDIVAALTFYVDNSQVTVYDPTFIVDEGKDAMTFNYSLSGLSVGAHEFDIRLEMDGGSGSIAIGDVHELLWGYGITFEVYAKGIEITTLPKKTVYYVGQRLDYSGLVVSEYFNNGTKVGVSTLVNLDPVSGTLLTDDDVGTLTVDADYDGFFADFDVTVRTLGFEFVMSEDVVPEAIRYNFSGNFEELSTGLHWLNVNFTSSYNLNLRSAQLTVGNDGIVDVSNGQDLTVNTRADRKWVAAKNGDYIFFFGSTQTQISSSYYEFYAESIYPTQSSPSVTLELLSDDQPTWSVFSVYINGSGYSGGDPFAGWNMFFIDGYLVMPNIKFAYRTSTSNFVAAFGYGIEVSDNHFVLHIKADSYETETGRNDEIRNLLRGAVKGTSQFRYGANGGSKEYILDNPKYCQIVKKIDGQNYIEIYRLHCTDSGVTYTLIDRFETNLIDYETYSWAYSDSPKAFAIHGTDNFYVYGIGSNMATYYMGFYDVTANTYSEWIVTNASLVPQGVKEYCYDATSGLYFYVCPTSLLGSTEYKQVLFASADLHDWTKFEYITDFFNKITDGQIVHNGNIVVVGRTDNEISGNKICGVYFKEVG